MKKEGEVEEGRGIQLKGKLPSLKSQVPFMKDYNYLKCASRLIIFRPSKINGFPQP